MDEHPEQILNRRTETRRQQHWQRDIDREWKEYWCSSCKSRHLISGTTADRVAAITGRWTRWLGEEPKPKTDSL